ncbi:MULTISPECIES: hypothetical protein [unclassified Sphingobacterium]|uniref:hypothetical protein n=1 Tax=unclassified Sphingobacterium TaxID=2609468 RepID=UPI0025EC95A5|nr:MULTISPECIES: hypothetical protein [unclassified Sphingobacterium]
MNIPRSAFYSCASKNDAVVKLTLPEDQKQIVASQYELSLPTEQQLLLCRQRIGKFC